MTRVSTYAPLHLHASVGTGMGDTFEITLVDGELVYVLFAASTGHSEIAVPVNAARWRGFRRTIDRVGAGNWAGRYEHSARTDGVDWSVDIAFRDGLKVTCDGYDAFPPDGTGPEFTKAFAQFCRAVSRLLGGAEFGWERSKTPESKGSRRRMYEWVHEHREQLERELCRQVPSLGEFALEPGSSINWLAPDPEGREIRDGLWRQVLAAPTPQEDGFWPKRGPVWDAAGLVASGKEGEGTGIVLVEAKAHTAELVSPRMSPASYEADRQREAAMDEAKLAFKAAPSAAWTLTYYQLANRLTFLYYLRVRQQRPAWLVNIYFCGDSFRSGGIEVVGPADAAGWTEAIAQAKAALGIGVDHPLSAYVADVFLPAMPPRQ